MCSIRFTCLHVLNQWYEDVNRKRGFVYANYLRCSTILIWTCLFLQLASFCTAQNQIHNQLIFSEPNISVKNVTILPFIRDEKIYLNISWYTDVNLSNNYKIELRPLHKNDHCEDTAYDELDSSSNKTSIVFNEKEVHPDCPYEISFIPNPRLSKVGLKLNYTVPDCVETRCSCKKIHQLPKPELEFNILSSDYEIALTISANKQWLSMNKLSKVKYRFVNMNNSGDDFNIEENITNENANKIKQLLFDKDKLDHDGAYTLVSTVIDRRGCEIAAAKMHINTSPSYRTLLSEGELVKNLRIHPYQSEESKCIELQVTWDKVLEDWYPEGYVFEITSLSTEGHCKVVIDHEVFNILKNATSVTIKPTKIIPGCPYTMELIPQPRNARIGSHMNITIPASLSQKEQPFHWVFTVMIPAMFILMLSGVLLVFMKQRKCSWLLRKLCFLNNQCPSQTHVRSIYRHANLDANRGRAYFSVPMERNDWYIEKEILDEIERGKADKFELSHSKLKFEHKIGGGAFGQVFLAMAAGIRGMPGCSPVAVKTLKKSATSEELDEFLLEIAMLKQIGNHPNIVRLLGCCTITPPHCMIMEYIPCGDLRRYLQALRNRYERKGKKSFVFNESKKASESSSLSYIMAESLPSSNRPHLPSVTETEYTMLNSEGIPLTPSTPQSCSSPLMLECELDPNELQNFALQIAKGMEYLEAKQIVHRDLAARNVLIDENKVLKISDFGLSRRGIYVNTKPKTVPLRWLSVEAIRDHVYTSKSDVWAYAIVLWEIGTLGAFPYPALTNNELLDFLLAGQRLDKPDNCTEELYELMLRCWADSVDRRPSFEELVRHLEAISNRRRVYVDFSQLNPSYMFPPTEEQTITCMRTENNVKTIEIILTDK